MATATTPPVATTGPAAGARETTPPEPRHFNVGRAFAWVFMILVILVSLFPFYWMLRTALSSNNALYAGSNSVLPVQASGGGFERVFGLQTGQRGTGPAGPRPPSTSRRCR